MKMNENYMKTDCYAYSGEGYCTALRETDCESCKFYKTREEYRKERKKNNNWLEDALKNRKG